jgi:hypothetical protein
MLSKPDNWEFSVNGITSQMKETRNTVNKWMRELESLGYLKKEEIRSAGKFVGVEYVVYHEPYPKIRDTVSWDHSKKEISKKEEERRKELEGEPLVKEKSSSPSSLPRTNLESRPRSREGPRRTEGFVKASELIDKSLEDVTRRCNEG